MVKSSIRMKLSQTSGFLGDKQMRCLTGSVSGISAEIVSDTVWWVNVTFVTVTARAGSTAASSSINLFTCVAHAVCETSVRGWRVFSCSPSAAEEM
ncbi:MAG: hypothetical protein ACK526_02910 [Planctomyces sp.]